MRSALHGDKRQFYRNLWMRARDLQMRPENPVAIARKIDPMREPWRWLSAINGGGLVKPIPPELPCPGCFLSENDQYRLLVTFLKHTKIAMLTFSYGLKKTDSGKWLAFTIKVHKLPYPAWSREAFARDEAIMDNYIVEDTTHKRTNALWDVGNLQLNADVVYNVLSEAPHSLFIFFVRLQSTELDFCHAVAIIFSLSPNISHDEKAEASRRPAVIGTFPGTDPAKTVYMLPIDMNGFFGSEREIDEELADPNRDKDFDDSMQHFKTMTASCIEAMRNFAAILRDVKFDAAEQRTVLSPSSAGISLVGTSMMATVKATRSSCRTYVSSGAVPPRLGTVGGYCTTASPLTVLAILTSKVTQLNIAYDLLVRMSKESKLSQDEILGRISFNARSLFSGESTCCHPDRRPADRTMWYTVHGQLRKYPAPP